MRKGLKKIILLSFLFVVFFSNTIFASDLNPGDILFEKSAEWVDKENGIAKVTLKLNSEPVVKPADVILLVDRSNSMTFGDKWDLSGKNGIYSKCMNKNHWINNKHYYDTSNVNNWSIQDFYDKENGCTDRFDVTIDSVNNFLDIFYNYSSENRVAYVSFCNTSSNEYNEYFTNNKSIISNDDINNLGIIQKSQNNISGGTSYSAGFNAVEEYIKKRNLEESGNENINSRQTYVIFLTDGKPTDGNLGLSVARKLKDMGIIIYAIGIGEVDDSNLSSIATESINNSYYKSVSSAEELNNIYENIASRIYNAGTDAYIIDVIGKDFEYYENDTYKPTEGAIILPPNSEDGKTIKWYQNEILKGEKLYEFYIKLKDGEEYDNGTWNTNENAELLYKDINMKDGSIIADIPNLSRHKYVVEYYLENVDGSYPTKANEKEEYWTEEGETVIANPKSFEGYVFNKDVEGTILEGVIEEDNKVTLKLYYQIPRSKVVVRYVDENGIDIIDEVELEGRVGEEYTTERKQIEGYKALGEDPENQVGTYSEENQEVVYMYEREIGKVIIEYIDTNGNNIADDDLYEGFVGEEYITDRKDIDGYVAYGNDPQNAKGVYTNDEILVTYVYETQDVDVVDTSDINIRLYAGIFIAAIIIISIILVGRKRLNMKNDDK